MEVQHNADLTDFARDAVRIRSPFLPSRAGYAGAAGIRLRELCLSVYAEHRVLLLLVSTYILAGGVVLGVLHRAWPIHFTNPTFALAWLAGSGIWLLWQYLRGGPRLFHAALTPERVVGAVLVLALIVPGQITFQALKQSIGPLIGFSADPVLYRVDVLLHGRMSWQWLAPLLAYEPIVRAFDFLYMVWVSGLLLFVLWASWSRHRAVRQRALIAFATLWIVAGTFAAATASSAGPCYYGATVSGENPYAGLMARLDAIGETSHKPLSARTIQRRLWNLQESNEWNAFGGVSAMPSLHVGISVLFILIAWRLSKRVAILLAFLAVAIQVGSVLLGWHYAVDGYAGALLAFLSWKIAERLTGGHAVQPAPQLT